MRYRMKTSAAPSISFASVASVAEAARSPRMRHTMLSKPVSARRGAVSRALGPTCGWRREPSTQSFGILPTVGGTEAVPLLDPSLGGFGSEFVVPAAGIVRIRTHSRQEQERSIECPQWTQLGLL